MSQTGNRHALLLYTRIVDRWWRLILPLGVLILALAAGLKYLPALAPSLGIQPVSSTSLWVAGGIGAFALLVAVLLLSIRKAAYVQPCDNHLRLVTPFLRLKIAYRRIRQSACVEIGRLYPQAFIRRKRAILQPLVKSTLVVLDLNGLPLSRAVLSLFLSPLFFPDKTARLALLVTDWIKFSTELESYRSSWQDAQHQPNRAARMPLYSDQNPDRQ